MAGSKHDHVRAQDDPVGLPDQQTGPAWQERMTHYLRKVIFFGLLTLIPLTSIPYGTTDAGWEAIFEVSVFTLGGLWIIECLLSQSWHLKRLSLLLPLLALVMIAIFQMLPLWKAGPISADPFETRRFIIKLVALITAGELLLYYTSNQRRLRGLIFAIIVTALASALFGIVRQSMQDGVHPFLLSGLGPDIGYGQFINRNHFAFLMEMALGLMLGLLVGGSVRRHHYAIYLALLMPIWLALILSLSRGGIFAMLCQIIFIAILPMVKSFRPTSADQSEAPWLWRFGSSQVFRFFLIVPLIIAVVIGVIFFGGDPLAERLKVASSEVKTDITAEDRGLSRLEIWRSTWQLIRDHPIAGVGFGGYWVAIPEYHNASGTVVPQQAHNDYLEVLASGGMIGIATLIWSGIAFIKRARERLRSEHSLRRAASLGALTGLFGIAIHSFFDFGLHVTVNALVFTALIVLAIADVPHQARMAK